MNFNAEILNRFAPISLSEMDSVSLMKRTDTKFVVPLSKLEGILARVIESYRVLEIGEKRMMTYSSLYFDTANNQFYKDHHNGKVNRLKIRIRNYVESGLYFLEIKQKNGKGMTKKSRIRLNDFQQVLEKPSLEFIQKITHHEMDLAPTLLNNFQRITLVNLEAKERATIDIGLYYSIGEKTTEISDLVIIELKQEKFNRNSAIFQSLYSHGLKPLSISKYCMGMLSLNENLKHNRFKQKMRTIHKLLAA